MTEKYQAAVAGHLCLDVIPDMSHMNRDGFERMFRPGRLLDVGPVTIATGGAVSNTGLALNKLGIRTALMGKIGTDMFGEAIKSVVATHGAGLTDALLIDPAATSSYTVIINPPGIDRIFLHCPSANDTFSPSDVRYDLLSDVRLFHFGYPPLMKRMYENDGVELVDIFKRVKGMGLTTSLDMALPDVNSPAGRANWPAIVRGVLPYVDVFLPSIEEILYMIRRDTYTDLLDRAGNAGLMSVVTPELLHDLSSELIGMGVKIVGLKLGECGLYVRTAGESQIAAIGHARPTNPSTWANKELWAPCFQVEVVGASGSGDSTIAGFLSALLRDMTPEQTVTTAVAVGACNVERADTLSGVRTWDETMARIARGWARLPMIVSAPGWCHDAAQGLWTVE
jgi:sugar/nucleoside kinase (ribokinase family)